ncbi:MAG: tRNA (guanosine(37)-N1)-methyltransferase TrmD [Spirochaetales bacterium]|nr:tRNA (guanosine(37)-N1)-methyltransferase TrmD [Spirochaetales bacterium]
MKFTVLTLFPDIVEAFFTSSIMAKAVERGLIEYELINIRDFAQDKHRTCDDSPYGGGAGMVLKAEPLAAALDSVGGLDKKVVFPTPSGVPYTQKKAEEYAELDEIVLICGRYEGIDQRIIDLYVDDEVTIGDYVLSSGEVSSLVLIDSVYRLCSGVITQESLEEESFQDNLLEYPHYTRPEVFRGLAVPEILRGGHHAKIEEWRHEKRIEKTKKNRPDLWDLNKSIEKSGGY